MNFKADSKHKELTPGEIKRHEEQIARLIESLNDPIQGAAQIMATGAEIPGNVINRSLSARKYGTERVDQFIKKKFLSREVRSYDPIQCSAIPTSLKKTNKQRMVISVLKEDHQILGLFVEKYLDKQGAFKYY